MYRRAAQRASGAAGSQRSQCNIRVGAVCVAAAVLLLRMAHNAAGRRCSHAPHIHDAQAASSFAAFAVLAASESHRVHRSSERCLLLSVERNNCGENLSRSPAKALPAPRSLTLRAPDRCTLTSETNVCAMCARLGEHQEHSVRRRISRCRKRNAWRLSDERARLISYTVNQRTSSHCVCATL